MSCHQYWYSLKCGTINKQVYSVQQMMRELSQIHKQDHNNHMDQVTRFMEFIVYLYLSIAVCWSNSPLISHSSHYKGSIHSVSPLFSIDLGLYPSMLCCQVGQSVIYRVQSYCPGFRKHVFFSLFCCCFLLKYSMVHSHDQRLDHPVGLINVLTEICFILNIWIILLLCIDAGKQL